VRVVDAAQIELSLRTAFLVLTFGGSWCCPLTPIHTQSFAGAHIHCDLLIPKE
jgi:hypothetical protein